MFTKFFVKKKFLAFFIFSGAVLTAASIFIYAGFYSGNVLVAAKTPQWAQETGDGISVPACMSSGPTATCNPNGSASISTAWTTGPLESGCEYTFINFSSSGGTSQHQSANLGCSNVSYTWSDAVSNLNYSWNVSYFGTGLVYANFSGQVTTPSCAAPLPSPPTGLVATCVSPGTAAGLAWNPSSGATYYAVRADKDPGTWNGLCDGAQNAGDVCENVTGTTKTFNSEPGKTYSWWVHACNSAGCSGLTSGSNFTCVAPAATFTLSVNSSGASSVSITSSTGHGGTTNYTKPSLTSGTSVSLTAPSTSGGNNFSSWSGCDSVSGATCSLTMSANKTATANYTAPAPSFNFSLFNGGDKSVTQGSSVTNSVTATLLSGATQSVSFSASGLPSGATASFSPTSCNPTCSTTITISTQVSTPTGNSTITVTGIGGGLSKTTQFTLTVNTSFTTGEIFGSIFIDADNDGRFDQSGGGSVSFPRVNQVTTLCRAGDEQCVYERATRCSSQNFALNGNRIDVSAGPSGLKPSVCIGYSPSSPVYRTGQISAGGYFVDYIPPSGWAVTGPNTVFVSVPAGGGVELFFGIRQLPIGDFTLTNGALTCNSVPLSWTAAPNATAYRILKGSARVDISPYQPYTALNFTDTTVSQGFYQYQIEAYNTGNTNRSNEIRVTTPACLPTLDFSGNPTSIYEGQSTTLTWSTTNTNPGNPCTASGGWSGNKAGSGSEVVFPSPPPSVIYSLSCNGPGGAVSKSVTINISSFPSWTEIIPR